MSFVQAYSFAGQSFTHPEQLAQHFRRNWSHGAALFRSAADVESLTQWLTRVDPHVPRDLLAVTSRPDATDTRIIRFTARYLGGNNQVVKGQPVSSASLARLYQESGPGWRSQGLLASISAPIASALAEGDQSFARFASNVDAVDAALDQAGARISAGVSSQINGVDVGAEVRAALPAAVARAGAGARAALLDAQVAADIRSGFVVAGVAHSTWANDLRNAAQAAPEGPSLALQALYVVLAPLDRKYHSSASSHERDQRSAMSMRTFHKTARVGLIGVALACLASIVMNLFMGDVVDTSGYSDWPAPGVQPFLAFVGLLVIVGLGMTTKWYTAFPQPWTPVLIAGLIAAFLGVAVMVVLVGIVAAVVGVALAVVGIIVAMAS